MVLNLFDLPTDLSNTLREYLKTTYPDIESFNIQYETIGKFRGLAP